MEWFPDKEDKLNKILDYLLSKSHNTTNNNLNGLIVPHAGYAYSGKIAGKAYSLIKNKSFKKAIIFGPSHKTNLKGIATLENIKTPLGEINITKNHYKKISNEHSIKNQIPFLQKLGIKKVLPLVVGKISHKKAKEIAKEFSDKNALFIFSTDLSHFLPYDNATNKDKKTIKSIKNLNTSYLKNNLDCACGIFPLLILFELCKLKNWEPKLIEYKNSGDITKEKKSVVGYASFYF